MSRNGVASGASARAMASEQAAKIKVQEDMLYSGRVKDAPRTGGDGAKYRSAQATPARAWRRRRWQSMMELEQAEQELIDRVRCPCARQRGSGGRTGRLQEETRRPGRPRPSTRGQRDALAGRLSTPTLEHYEALRQKRGSMVVVPPSG